MPKTLDQKGFNAAIVTQVNRATKNLALLAKLAENYPQFLTEKAVAKIDAHFAKSAGSVVDRMQAAMETKTAASVEAFSLDEPTDGLKRGGMAESEVVVAEPKPEVAAKPEPEPEPATKPVSTAAPVDEDDELAELAAMMDDAA